MPRAVTVKEAAAALDVDATTVCRLIHEGRLHAVNISSNARKVWRIPVSAIEEFLGQSCNMVSPPGTSI